MLLFDGFETFKADRELSALFSNVELVRISINKENRLANIYLDSPKIIEYPKIAALEEEIYKQIFSKGFDKVHIEVHFSLSGSYPLSRIIDLYRESILAELKNINVFDYYIVSNSDIDINDEKSMINIRTVKQFVTLNREHSLAKWIMEMFRKRFDMDVYVEFEYIGEAKKENINEPAMYEVFDVSTMQSFMVSPDDYARGVSHEAIAEEKKAVSKDNEPKTGSSPKHSKKQPENQPIKKNTKPNIGQTASKQTSKYDKFKPKAAPDPELIYGKDITGDVIAISEISEELGEVVIQGMVDSSDIRELKTGNFLIILNITDFTDTISVKLFVRPSDYEYLKDNIKDGKFIKVKGNAAEDKYDHDIAISGVRGIKPIKPFSNKVKRNDTSEKKRVELHCHTQFSDMDGVSAPKDILKRAVEWGHKALAITDHGIVQAFPVAMHAKEKIKDSEDFKIIYGLEGYLVDDEKPIVRNDAGQSLDDSYVIFDIETTGLNPYKHKVIEIGAVKVCNGIITDRFSEFVNPLISIPYEIEELTHITDAMLKDAETIDIVLPRFLEFCEGSALVAHNADFDTNFIRIKAEELGIDKSFTICDTLALSRLLLTELKTFNLKSVSKALGVVLESHHRAVDDAEATSGIFLRLFQMLKDKGMHTLKEINEYAVGNVDYIRKTPSHHVILLAANDTGRINMYRLVSDSHITYYNKQPKIPKSLLASCREGLIIGSACEAGELYQALIRGETKEEIDRLAKFYDYFEIQPVGNNEFMLRDRKYGMSKEDDLREVNKRIVELGEIYQKPVCATSDVHFLDPEDEIYRRIIMAGKGFDDADKQPPLFLHTTEEMLSEFSYLGEEKAYEVVVENTNIIADRIEEISPVRPDKCPPVFENSDSDLRNICFEKAHSMYGDELPEIVEKRLTKELDSIINNGYSVMYIIAQKLVWKSNEDGYLVGSRGSVGSSFAATMSGITEVNPLPAHYYCPKCRYSDFDSDIVKEYADKSGFDMPDARCPVCNELMNKDGHNIPFETFLGFKGDKEPDIDLNFSGEYQSNAHKYTEVLFGKGNTFRAGTIGTLAEKTAYGYVMKYYEERGIKKRRAEMERIARGCTGVRRTTGQHPGGIVVIPKGENIYSFTPIQKPANDMSVDIITTHFEYHSIDHNLLKLDILGHDDPTMIRMLQDITGMDVKDIPLSDPKVMSLFNSTEALGIRPDDIGGCELGSLGIPEFGTGFSMQMLIETAPSTFSELVRISGLSHGTDVWTNNAQDLIKSGECTLSTAICTRDDIMTYLISEGVENSAAFKIMESVRKGKGLTDEMKEIMIENNIPEWYIGSCLKIKYMFPKAHAVAYVMMAIRIAWFKVYKPLAYYAAFFSIRAKTFDYETMARGRDTLDKNLDMLLHMEKPTAKDKESIKDMRIVQEMYARGIKFEPIDLYKVKADRFQIIDGKLMPALNTIEGLGGMAAEAVVNEAANGEFFSIDDFRSRTKVGQKTIDKMKELNLFGDLSESNQMSILDYLK